MRLSFLAPTALVFSATLAPAASLYDQYHVTGRTVAISGTATALDDGRLLYVTSSGDTGTFHLETSSGSNTFVNAGTFTNLDLTTNYGPGFVTAIADGDHIDVAVGDNGVSSVGVYKLSVGANPSITSAQTFAANTYDARWTSTHTLVYSGGTLAGSTGVSVLDTAAGVATADRTTTLITGLAGASGGVAFDSAGNLYTGDGYAYGTTSQTGDIKRFSAGEINTVLHGGSAIDFDSGGTLVATLLSANTLNIDNEGNLLVGGGKPFDGIYSDYIALAKASALTGNPVLTDNSDVNAVRKLGNGFGFPGIVYNAARNEIYVTDYTLSGAVVIGVPEPSSLALMAVPALALLRRRAR